ATSSRASRNSGTSFKYGRNISGSASVLSQQIVLDRESTDISPSVSTMISFSTRPSTLHHFEISSFTHSERLASGEANKINNSQLSSASTMSFGRLMPGFRWRSSRKMRSGGLRVGLA